MLKHAQLRISSSARISMCCSDKLLLNVQCAVNEHYYSRKRAYLTSRFVTLSRVRMPNADSSTYAHFVFNVFDQDRDGTVSFEVWRQQQIKPATYQAICLVGALLRRPAGPKFEADDLERGRFWGGVSRPLPTARESGERCKFPQRGLRQSPDCKCVLDALRAQKTRLLAAKCRLVPAKKTTQLPLKTFIYLFIYIPHSEN